jgi:alanine racemase
MSKVLETTLEIDLKALTHNFNFLKSKLQPTTKFLGVVKAFAYGSDAIEIAKHLQLLGTDYLAVAYVKEGVALRDAGVTLPILVLHPQPVNFKTLIDRCLEPSLYSFKVLDEFIEVSKNLNQSNYPVHIKMNTGLNRLGFNADNIEAVCDSTKINASIKIKSVFSHLAASEDLNESKFTLNQISQFKLISEKFSSLLEYRPWFHICNTSGTLNYPEAHFDMVRCGISLYGFGNDPKYDQHLKPIASLKSVISQIHSIKKGESIGYNRALVAKDDMKTATIPIGHADGISRIYGNGKGFVYINNQKALIAGNVCMDMIMVDITNVNCLEGDEVIIFNNNHTAHNLAMSAGTISYEILTAISHRVKRHYIK